jgi:saccharopine dehydrogenase (NAD+, L-lysine-forming)
MSFSGSKKFPSKRLLDIKTYVFFSHTIKGQKDNMPLLQRIMDSGSTLIDYEKITDEKERRLIYFGPYAGDAGAIDILSLMGEHWADRGIDTPFAAVRRAHQYDSVEAARKHLADIGRKIQKEGFAPGAVPVYRRHPGLRQRFRRRPGDFRLPADRAHSRPMKSTPSSAKGRGNRHTVYVTVFQRAGPGRTHRPRRGLRPE